jgi:hypothetical protein
MRGTVRLQGRQGYGEEQVGTIDLHAGIPAHHLGRRGAKIMDLGFISEEKKRDASSHCDAMTPQRYLTSASQRDR